MNVVDVDGDGIDEINVGGAMINADGSLRWSGWYRYFTPGTHQTTPGGNWQKIGHGDWMVTGFFMPEHDRVVTWASFEGSMLDSALIDADTGEIIFFDQPTGNAGNNFQWAANRDTQRAIAGDFTSERGWTFNNNRGLWSSPFGPNTQGGHWRINPAGPVVGYYSPTGRVVGSASRALLMPQDNQVFWNADLSTATGSSSGGGWLSRGALNPAGTAYQIQRVLTAQGNQGLHWGQAAFIADVFGDWREEFGLLANVGSGGFTGPDAVHELRIYFNTDISEHRLFSLMTDRRYRVEAARYNTGYNIATVPGFYIGSDMIFENKWNVFQAQITDDFNPFRTILPHVEPPAEFGGTSPNDLRALLAEGYNVVLTTSPGNLGIFAQHSPFVIPEGSTLTIQTTLNIQRDAELVVEGTLIVLEGGRVNNQGGSLGGGTLRIAETGRVVNNGHIENVTNSTVINYGTIVNNARFEIRAGATFHNCGTVTGETYLNINRAAIIIEDC
jgi:hypothetical protein